MMKPMEREQEQELNFDGLLENASDALVLIGADGEIQYANAQAEHLFGYSAKELIGEPVGVLLPDRYRAGHILHRLSYTQIDPRQQEMSRTIDYLFGLRKDGGEFPVEVNLAPLPEGLTVAAIRKRDDVVRRGRNHKTGSIDVVIVVFVQLLLNTLLYFLLATS